MKLQCIVIAGGMLLASQAMADQAADQAQLNMLKSMMTQSIEKNIKQTSACTGKSKEAILKAANSAIESCYTKYKSEMYSDDDNDVFGDCMEVSIQSKLGLSQAKIQECTAESDEEYADDDYDDYDPNKSPEEYRDEMIRKASQYQAEMAMVSKHTLHLINLPIYPKSKMQTHIMQEYELMGVKAIPVATFISADQIAKVVAFYKKKLPNFKMKKLDDGQYIFMEDLPKDFNFAEDQKQTMKTPHVYITSLENVSAQIADPEVKTIIRIAYKR